MKTSNDYYMPRKKIIKVKVGLWDNVSSAYRCQTSQVNNPAMILERTVIFFPAIWAD